MLEDKGVSLNGDGDWLLSNGGLKLIWIFSWNIGVVGNTNLANGLGVFACLILSEIWILGLSLLTSVLQILESQVLPSSAASVRCLIAIDNLLLR